MEGDASWLWKRGGIVSVVFLERNRGLGNLEICSKRREAGGVFCYSGREDLMVFKGH